MAIARRGASALTLRALHWGSVALFAAGFSALAIHRHRAFDSGRFDLGNMTQAVWSTAHGDLLGVTTLAGEQSTRLASHFDPILVAFAPLWLAWPDPEMLLTAQAIAVALGAIPVFWLARKHVGDERAALGFAVAYLLYPPVQWLVLDDFHPVALACPLLLAAFWYLDEDRLVPFSIFAGLAALTKEEIGLAVAGFGLWYALSRGRRAAGAAIAALGLTVSIVAVEVVVPHAGETSAFYSRYDAIGGSAGGILRTLATDPIRIAREALSARDVEYLAVLALPLGGVFLLAPMAALAAVPELALNLLSATSTQTSIRFHYTAGLVPALVVATVLGAGVLGRRWPRSRPWLGAGAVALAIGGGFVPGPPPLQAAFAHHVSGHDRVAERALRLIPRDAAVSASNSLGAHLSDRRRILSVPRLAGATWAAFDEARPSYLDRYAPAEAAEALASLRRNSAWRVVFDRDGIVILRRVASRP